MTFDRLIQLAEECGITTVVTKWGNGKVRIEFTKRPPDENRPYYAKFVVNRSDKVTRTALLRLESLLGWVPPIQEAP